MKEYVKIIKELGACGKALEWLKAQDTDVQTAWETCERGDWMLWLIGKIAAGEPESEQRKRLVLASCACARLAIPEDKNKLEPSSLTAIVTAEKWARGENGVTINEVKKAAAAYYAAYYATYTAYSTDVADEAYYTAYAAALSVAPCSADYRKVVLKNCADIIRRYYPLAPEL